MGMNGAMVRKDQRYSRNLFGSKVAQILVVLLPLSAVLGNRLGVGPIFGYRILVILLAGLAIFLPGAKIWVSRDSVGKCRGFEATGCQLVQVVMRKLSVETLTAVVWAVLFAVVAAGSLLVSEVKRNCTHLLSVWLVILLGWVLAKLSKAGWLWLVKGWALSFLVTGAVAVWELVSKNHLPGYLAKYEGVTTNSDLGLAATFINPNMYAFYLTFGILVMGCAACYESGVWAKIYLACLVFSYPLLFFTYSRACLGCAVMIALALAILAKPTRRFALAIAGFGLLAAVMMLLASGRLQHDIETFSKIWQTIVVNRRPYNYHSETLRLGLIVNGVLMMLRYPLTGMGPGAFESAIVSEPNLVDVFGLTNAHFGFLEIGANYGAIVLVVLLVCLGWMLVKSVRIFRLADQRRWLAGFVIVAVLAMLILQLANSTLIGPSIISLALAIFVASCSMFNVEYGELSGGKGADLDHVETKLD